MIVLTTGSADVFIPSKPTHTAVERCIPMRGYELTISNEEQALIIHVSDFSVEKFLELADQLRRVRV